MASSRDREAWAHIFKLYKGLPHLWDKNNMNYGNRSMMTNGYKILTRVYREHLDKQASVDALRMKMKNLRTTYYRELRKIEQAQQKGEKYIPSLWYFDNLNFLGTSRSNISPNTTLKDDRNEDLSQTHDLIIMEYSTPIDDLASEKSDCEMNLASSTSQSKFMKQFESEKKNNSVKMVDTRDPLTDIQKKMIKDEHWEVIGKSIGYQLKELSKKQYTIVSKLISDAIYFGRLNKLTEDAHIETGTSHYTLTRNNITGLRGSDVLTNHNHSTFKLEEVEDDEDS